MRRSREDDAIRIMEKRDAVFFLFLLGGGGYAVYSNWDTIATNLGLEELDPGCIKAVVLAKKESSFERGAANWQFLQSRRQRGEIEFARDPWEAKAIGGQDYRVMVRWVEDGVHVAHGFRVNIATRTIVYDGPIEDPASPR